LRAVPHKQAHDFKVSTIRDVVHWVHALGAGCPGEYAVIDIEEGLGFVDVAHADVRVEEVSGAGSEGRGCGGRRCQWVGG
jgi:hypothetical protein